MEGVNSLRSMEAITSEGVWLVAAAFASVIAPQLYTLPQGEFWLDRRFSRGLWEQQGTIFNY